MSYDLIVIGTGPGGYVCAIRAAQLGMKVAVVEKRATHGGTCLNVGCIPSKALLHASELFEEAGHSFARMGIGVGTPKLDLAALMKFKDEGVDGNVKGVEFLLKKNKIDAVRGLGRIGAQGNGEVKIEVTAPDGKTQTLETKNIVIATGSDVARLKGVDIDGKRVVTSDQAIALDKVPQRLLVIGAGVIGLELGSVWRRLGSQVTVVEFLDRILPGLDNEVARQSQRLLEKQGIAFKLGSKVTGVDSSGATLKAKIEPAQKNEKPGGAAETIEADVVLVAIGRVPYTEGLGLDEAGVKKDNRGRVIVDAHYATNVKGIYAIGDVIAGPMLAHKAEDEGMAVAEILAGQAGHVNYDVIPNVVYTFPEIASVGKTEEELKEAGVAYNTGKFPFTANGRAKANHQTDGFVKILADAKTDRVLGVHIVCSDAGNMIAEAAVAMEFGAAAEDIARTCHAHPTLPEAVKEAALAVAKRAIHF
jgi:dihydrolipoamide dehydrogenase